MATGPQRFGKFVVTGELGRGGQGAVLRATDPAGRPVALKLLLKADPKHERRFRQEAQVLARLDHPGIVRVVDAGVEDGVPWLAMALVEGDSLGAVVERGGPLAPMDAARMVASTARAIAHCHAQGVVHRDLKPENVLVDRRTGQPVLVDFGLIRRDAEVFGALSIDDRSKLSMTGELRGTPAFMAPEQVNASRFGPVGPATDVYGLGGLLCALLTGDPPHVEPSLPGLMVSILEGRLPDFASRRPDAPPALVAICARALAAEPGERWPSAAALAQALEDFVEGRAVAPSRRPLALLAALAALVTLVALLLVLGPWGSSDGVATARGDAPGPSAPAPTPAPTAPAPPPAPVAAPPPVEVVRPEPSFDPVMETELPYRAWTVAALSPEPGSMAVGTFGGQVELLGAGGQLVWRQQVEGEVKGIAFTQDGRRFATWGNRCALRVWDAERGTCVVAGDPLLRIVWSAALRGERLYATVAGRAGEGMPEQVLVLDAATLAAAGAPLPRRGVESLGVDGDRLVGTVILPGERAPSPSTLVLFDLTGGDPPRARGVPDLPPELSALHLSAGCLVPGADLAIASVRDRPGLFVWDARRDRASVCAAEREDGKGGGTLAVAGDLAVVGTFEGDLLAWSLQDRRARFLRRVSRAHAGVIMTVSLSADGRRMVTGGADGVVRVWRLGG